MAKRLIELNDERRSPKRLKEAEEPAPITNGSNTFLKNCSILDVDLPSPSKPRGLSLKNPVIFDVNTSSKGLFSPSSRFLEDHNKLEEAIAAEKAAEKSAGDKKGADDEHHSQPSSNHNNHLDLLPGSSFANLFTPSLGLGFSPGLSSFSPSSLGTPHTFGLNSAPIATSVLKGTIPPPSHRSFSLDFLGTPNPFSSPLIPTPSASTLTSNTLSSTSIPSLIASQSLPASSSVASTPEIPSSSNSTLTSTPTLLPPLEPRVETPKVGYTTLPVSFHYSGLNSPPAFPPHLYIPPYAHLQTVDFTPMASTPAIFFPFPSHDPQKRLENEIISGSGAGSSNSAASTPALPGTVDFSSLGVPSFESLDQLNRKPTSILLDHPSSTHPSSSISATASAAVVVNKTNLYLYTMANTPGQMEFAQTPSMYPFLPVNFTTSGYPPYPQLGLPGDPKQPFSSSSSSSSSSFPGITPTKGMQHNQNHNNYHKRNSSKISDNRAAEALAEIGQPHNTGSPYKPMAENTFLKNVSILDVRHIPEQHLNHSKVAVTSPLHAQGQNLSAAAAAVAATQVNHSKTPKSTPKRKAKSMTPDTAEHESGDSEDEDDDDDDDDISVEYTPLAEMQLPRKKKGVLEDPNILLQKKTRRKERCRIAATKFRMKKRREIEKLEKETEELTSQKDALSKTVQELKKKVVELKTFLLDHKECFAVYT